MHHRVVLQVVAEGVEARLGRQFPVQQQVGHFHEGAALGQLFDGVAAITQDAFAAVDEGDLAGAGRGGGEAGIVGEITQPRGKTLDVQCRLAFGAADDGQFNLFARRLVVNQDFIAGHRFLLHSVNVSTFERWPGSRVGSLTGKGAPVAAAT